MWCTLRLLYRVLCKIAAFKEYPNLTSQLMLIAVLRIKLHFVSRKLFLVILSRESVAEVRTDAPGVNGR